MSTSPITHGNGCTPAEWRKRCQKSTRCLFGYTHHSRTYTHMHTFSLSFSHLLNGEDDVSINFDLCLCTLTLQLPVYTYLYVHVPKYTYLCTPINMVHIHVHVHTYPHSLFLCHTHLLNGADDISIDLVFILVHLQQNIGHVLVRGKQHTR